MTDLLVRLYDLPDAAAPVLVLDDEAFTIRRAMAYEKHLAVQWVREHFGKRWASECDVSFSNRPISCYLATKMGGIIGFACYDSTCRNYFGPTGVLETFRGQGIGKALLLKCLFSMRENGYAYAIIGSAGPKEFYCKAVGAMEIPNSTPGVYRDLLSEEFS